MPPFLRGRLFWKIFVFFFLAQVTGIVVTGVAIWATLPEGAGGFRPPPPVAAAALPRPDVSASSGLPQPPDGPPLPPPGPRFPLKHLLAGTLASLVFAALLAAYIARPVRRLRAA